MKGALVFFFLVSSFWANGQRKQAAVWILGGGCYLDFNKIPLKNQYTPLGGTIGVSTVCDSNGMFQFYSNPQNVRNRTREVMPYGLVSSGNQSGGQFIISHPDSSHLYRLFLIVVRTLTSRTINMKLDSGLGEVVATSIKHELNPVADHLACMLHANERDSWVVGHMFNSDTLFALLVTENGVVDTVYTDTGTPAKKPNYKAPFTTEGYDCPLKSSPDSRMLFVPRRTLDYPFHELYKFDRETGKFSDRLLIKDTVLPSNSSLLYNAFPDGAFSPDSKLLYTSTGFRRALALVTDGPGIFWQYSLENYDSAVVEQSKIYIGKWDRFVANKPERRPYSPRLQLAINGKIYISPGVNFDTLMSIIQCPNSRGVNCHLDIRALNLHPTFPLPTDYSVGTGSFFPTLNQTFVRNAGIFQVQANKRKICVGDTLELSGYGAGAEHFTWSVSPALPQGVKVDTLTWQKLGTGALPIGNYTFTCRATSRCGDVFEKNLVVEVLPLPGPTQPPQRGGVNTPCIGDSVFLFVPNPQTGVRYFWSTGEESNQIVVKQSGKYSLDSVATAQGCGLKVSDTVTVTIKNAAVPPPPVLLSPLVVSICEGQTARLKVQTQNAKVVWSNGLEGDSVVVTGGQYSVISETAEGCQSASSDTVRVVEVPYPTPVFVNIDSVLTRDALQNRNYCVAGLPGSTFSFSVQGGTAVDSSEDCITINWLPATINRLLTATETRKEAGCKGSASQIFLYRPALKVPNLVTANDDGRNDRFVIEDLQFYASHHLQIFNRWGKKVLDTHHYQNDWPEPEGLYFYSLVVDGMEMKGWVEVMK